MSAASGAASGASRAFFCARQRLLRRATLPSAGGAAGAAAAAAGAAAAAAWLPAPPARAEEAASGRGEAATWECLAAYATDQAGELAAGRGPRRSAEIDARYRRYFAWCQERGIKGAQYLVQTAPWRAEHCGPWVALEPNIVPYDMDRGIEHWNLWYHPHTTPGAADLDLQRGACVELRGQQGRILSVRRTTYGAPETYVVATASDLAAADALAGAGLDAFVVDDAGLETASRVELGQPTGALSQGRWAAVLRHVRLFLPSLCEDEVLIFQNLPEVRSVPEVAHAHVFIRPHTPATRAALGELRRQWRLRSPWAEEERLTGRGDSVGFASCE